MTVFGCRGPPDLWQTHSNSSVRGRWRNGNWRTSYQKMHFLKIILIRRKCIVHGDTLAAVDRPSKPPYVRDRVQFTSRSSLESRPRPAAVRRSAVTDRSIVKLSFCGAIPASLRLRTSGACCPRAAHPDSKSISEILVKRFRCCVTAWRAYRRRCTEMDLLVYLSLSLFFSCGNNIQR